MKAVGLGLQIAPATLVARELPAIDVQLDDDDSVAAVAFPDYLPARVSRFDYDFS